MPYIGNPIYQSAFVVDQFSGTGSQTAYTMSVAPAGTTNVLVVVSGVVQDPSTYGVVGNTLTFSSAPPSGTGNISCRYLGVPATGVTTTAYRTLTEFTATAGQTTFTPPSYTVGYINVLRNGVQLGTADFTASNGTTVVLASGATAGDLITTESFYVSSLINAVPTTGGTITGNLFVTGTAFVGAGSPISGATNPLLASSGTANNYVQTYVYNGTNGANSSADFTAYPSNGADAAGWVDMGMTSPAFSQATYSVTGPNEAYLFGSGPSGTTGTGNLVLATDSTGTANSIQMYTNGFSKAKNAYAWQLDKNGYVTTPYHPAFYAEYTTTSSISQASGVIVWNNAQLNRGSNYNTANGKFTAPVAGVYYFACNTGRYDPASADITQHFRKNGSRYGSYSYDPANNSSTQQYHYFTPSMIISLAVGDTVDYYFTGGSGSSLSSAGNYFLGYLIG